MILSRVLLWLASLLIQAVMFLPSCQLLFPNFSFFVYLFIIFLFIPTLLFVFFLHLYYFLYSHSLLFFSYSLFFPSAAASTRVFFPHCPKTGIATFHVSNHSCRLIFLVLLFTSVLHKLSPEKDSSLFSDHSCIWSREWFLLLFPY